MKRVLFACLLSAELLPEPQPGDPVCPSRGFAYQSTPEAFAFVVGFFLLGIALAHRPASASARAPQTCGSRPEPYCSLRKSRPRHSRIIPQVYVTAASVPLIALIIVLAAALKASSFPSHTNWGPPQRGPK